ncbi:hypothetical protein CRG98_021246 [Punica granatum]|uniref:Uncharacterized protein n=1 Tax=Punica granatum TaxID=22663 RepID=A0A2I0JQ44_PUNGR|nr:hypothetical protein CRG98_021246 [Punica granatum]
MDVEGVWTCMGMHVCKPKGRWSTVGGHTDARVCGNQRRARGMLAAGAQQARGACAGRVRVLGLARGWRWASTIHPRVTISSEMHYLT